VIRRAETRADLERCVEICNAVHPADPVVLDQLVESDGAFLLHVGGGYAFVDRSSVPGSAYAMVRVRPEARRGGVGSALLAAVRTHAAAGGFERAWGRVSEADDSSLAFVRNRGFEEVARDVTVVRELAPGDVEAVPRGIVELQDEHLRAAHRVCVECIPEIHVPQRAEAPPFEEWVERESRQSPVAFVAVDNGEVVGYARLYETGTPHRLENGLTAVLPSHRRRGIAIALKRAQFAWAAEHGYREVVTEMAADNTAIRRVNERLGYRPLPASIVVSGSVA
jgi:GNAT superfamily N-acetyltransferase